MSDEVQVQEPTRRIVLWQRQGTHAGLWHIGGTDTDFPILPMAMEGLEWQDGHLGSVDYWKTTPRAHVYRERVEA